MRSVQATSHCANARASVCVLKSVKPTELAAVGNGNSIFIAGQVAENTALVRLWTSPLTAGV